MKSFAGKHWKEYVERRVCPRFQQLGNLVLARVLPAFDGINEEATALENRRRGELYDSLAVHEDDLHDAHEAMAELAFNEAMDYAVLLSEMRFSTLNLFAAALYHLTEQHLVNLPLEILNYDEHHDIRRPAAV